MAMCFYIFFLILLHILMLWHDLEGRDLDCMRKKAQSVRNYVLLLSTLSHDPC